MGYWECPYSSQGLQKVFFEVWGVFVKSLNPKFQLLCNGPSLLSSEPLGTSLFVLIVLLKLMEWSVWVKGRNMFTQLGSEFILLPLLVVLKLFLILFYRKHFAKGTLNGWEFFCLVLLGGFFGGNRSRRANVVVWHLREKELIIVTQISFGQE